MDNINHDICNLFRKTVKILCKLLQFCGKTVYNVNGGDLYITFLLFCYEGILLTGIYSQQQQGAFVDITDGGSGERTYLCFASAI